MARWMLGASALIAVGAIGYSVMRDDAAPVPTGAEQAGQEASAEQMIARLEERLADNSDDAEGWGLLGWAYYQQGRFIDAASAFRRAAVLEPANAEAHAMLGEALIRSTGDEGSLPAEARSALDRALELDPAAPRARYFRAVALDIDGKPRDAIEAWFELLEDTPADAPHAAAVRQAIANVAEANGIDVAERLRAASTAPTGGGVPMPGAADIEAAQSMSPSQRQDMIRGMVDRLAARLEEDPLNPDGWIMLMRSRVQLGDIDGAREARDESLRLFRNEATTTRRLEEAAQALGL